MLKWVNDLFRKASPAPVPASVAARAPLPPPQPAKEPALPSDLLRALREFSFDDFYTREEAGEPHLLQADSMKKDNYLHRFFSEAHDIIRYAHIENRSKELHEATSLKHDVAAFLSAQDPDTAAAFDTLFHFCRKYLQSVEEMAPEPTGSKNITVAKNGISNPEAAQLEAALGLIWKAVPDVNPYVVEGLEYVMEGNPAVAGAFSGYWWTKCDRRSDAGIAEKLASAIEKGYPHLRQDAAVAAQTAENMAGLKMHARDIAVTHLAWCLSRTIETGDNWNAFDKSRVLAKDILGRMAAGSTPAEEAKAVRGGVYGAPKPDDHPDAAKMQRTQKAMAAAEDYLRLGKDLHSGAWFETQRAQLLQLSAEALLTPQERALREAERRAKVVEEVAQGVIALKSTVSVKPPLQFRRAPGG